MGAISRSDDAGRPGRPTRLGTLGRDNRLVLKDFRRPARRRDLDVLASGRIRALQVGVAIFTVLLLASLIGVVLR
jgi:hypothetical protein